MAQVAKNVSYCRYENRNQSVISEGSLILMAQISDNYTNQKDERQLKYCVWGPCEMSASFWDMNIMRLS